MEKAYFYFSLIFLLFSCNNDNCSENLGFKLDYHLFEHIRINSNTYCELVNKSLLGDKQSILYISKVKVGDGATYQHGAVLIEIIDKIKEIEYLKIIQSLSKVEKNRIFYSYLPAGLEYTTNKKYFHINFDTAFPEISRTLSN